MLERRAFELPLTIMLHGIVRIVPRQIPAWLSRTPPALEWGDRFQPWVRRKCYRIFVQFHRGLENNIVVHIEVAPLLHAPTVCQKNTSAMVLDLGAGQYKEVPDFVSKCAECLVDRMNRPANAFKLTSQCGQLPPRRSNHVRFRMRAGVQARARFGLIIGGTGHTRIELTGFKIHFMKWTLPVWHKPEGCLTAQRGTYRFAGINHKIATRISLWITNAHDESSIYLKFPHLERVFRSYPQIIGHNLPLHFLSCLFPQVLRIGSSLSCSINRRSLESRRH
jgi:hypothetical protein